MKLESVCWFYEEPGLNIPAGGQGNKNCSVGGGFWFYPDTGPCSLGGGGQPHGQSPDGEKKLAIGQVN